MRLRRYSRASASVVAIVLLIGAGISVLFGERHERLDICVRCGAHRWTRSFGPFGCTLFRSAEVQPGALTLLHGRLLGNCRHDWEFDYGSGGGWLAGPREVGDAFAWRTYPAASLNGDQLLRRLERIPDPEAEKRALVAIGDRHNLTRFFAANALSEVELAPNGRMSSAAWAEWLRPRKWMFEVVADRVKAERIARSHVEDEDGMIAWAADSTLMAMGLHR